MKGREHTVMNALTIDVEDWYQALDFNFCPSSWHCYEDRIEYGLSRILELLDQSGVKATFFVLGHIAKKYPKMIRKISDLGHEIGSHGMEHRLVYVQGPEEFRKDVAHSKKLLEDIAGKKIVLFRASSWSISYNTLWALKILVEEGYTLDSSMQPFQTPLSGMRGMPETPFYPVINGERLDLLEFPPTVLPLYKGFVPFSGGFYFRALLLPVIKFALNKVNKTREGMIYIHPWEVDTEQPRLVVPPHIRFIHYHNLKSTYMKLESLIREFHFVPLGELIKNQDYKSIVIPQENEPYKNRSNRLLKV